LGELANDNEALAIKDRSGKLGKGAGKVTHTSPLLRRGSVTVNLVLKACQYFIQVKYNKP
jgi:hypothetical protein